MEEKRKGTERHLKIAAQFEIPFYQILDEKSQLVAELPAFAKDPRQLQSLYRVMVLTRLFDTKAIALQRTGKLGTYPSTRGQEAVFTGIGAAMQANDIFVPYYRDYAALYLRGVKFSEILLFWGGDEQGNCFASQKNDFPFSVPVGSQGLHAAGIATAFKIKGERRAVLTTCGEGATSQGDFYEALNVAGVWKLPVVFVINNNQWAISVPRSAQSSAQTLAQKAIAAGFSGEQVDGNDVIAVRDRVEAALQKARTKNEPTLLEMICYRQSDHTTADEASRYEPKGQRETEWLKEPIARLKKYLENNGLWSDADEKKCAADCKLEVEQIVQEYSTMSVKQPEIMLDYLYETLPQIYQAQREIVRKRGLDHG